MLGLKPQITPQFVPTSVEGWIQIAEITTLKSREALGPLPRFSRAPLPCDPLCHARPPPAFLQPIYPGPAWVNIISGIDTKGSVLAVRTGKG